VRSSEIDRTTSSLTSSTFKSLILKSSRLKSSRLKSLHLAISNGGKQSKFTCVFSACICMAPLLCISATVYRALLSSPKFFLTDLVKTNLIKFSSTYFLTIDSNVHCCCFASIIGSIFADHTEII
jgi:hypothetical protein